MRDLLSQLHKSLLSIGLEDAAKQIRVAQSLYKDDFRTEIRIFNALSKVLEDLKDLKPHQIYKEQASLPGYAIETSSERIIKDEESLQGYTKKEIVSGIHNYLESFIKNYMEPKFERLSYENEDKYAQAMNTISESLREVQHATRSVAKGSVQKLVTKVQRTMQDIDLFLRILKREIPKIESLKEKEKERWTSPLSKSLPSSSLLGGTDLKGDTWATALSNMEFDREAEMRAMESEYIDTHDIDTEDFYHMIKSFRSHIVEANYVSGLVRFAEDEPDIDLSDEDNKGNQKTPPAQPAPKDEKQPERKRTSLFDSGGNKWLDEPTNLRTIVTQVVTNGTLFTKDKSGKLHVFAPVIIFRAYYQYLLPQFRVQYASLLNVAHQNYLSMYQVQAVQNKLAKSLKLAAKALGG